MISWDKFVCFDRFRGFFSIPWRLADNLKRIRKKGMFMFNVHQHRMEFNRMFYRTFLQNCSNRQFNFIDFTFRMFFRFTLKSIFFRILTEIEIKFNMQRETLFHKYSKWTTQKANFIQMSYFLCVISFSAKNLFWNKIFVWHI